MTERTTISGLVLKTTHDAVLFHTTDNVEFWVPRSVCLDGDSVDDGDEDLVIANWWLEKEGHR